MIAYFLMWYILFDILVLKVVLACGFEKYLYNKFQRLKMMVDCCFWLFWKIKNSHLLLLITNHTPYISEIKAKPMPEN